MNQAYIYARVSTDEQADQGKSIEAQISIAKKWAKDNDYSISNIYSDEGKSATNINRPALQEMLLGCQERKNINAILVLDTDRLARNTLDHLTIKSLLKKTNTKVISISQPMIDDSPEGNLIDTIIASVNAFQSQVTGRKTSKVMYEKAKYGWYPGTPPIGYKNIENTNPSSSMDKKIIVFNEQVSTKIQNLFTLYSTSNYSLKQLAEYLKAEGITSKNGKDISGSRIADILKNEFYIGNFSWKKEKFKGKHPAMVEDSLFYKVQEVMTSHRNGASRKRIHKFLLSGYLFCETCGKQMIGEYHKKKSGKEYSFYACKDCGSGSYESMDDIDLEVQKLFKKIKLSKSYTDRVFNRAKEILEETRANESKEQKYLFSEKHKLELAVTEAEDSRFVNRTISDEQYQKITKRFTKKIEDIENKLNTLKKDHQKRMEALREILNLAEDIGRSYSKALYPQKRTYINMFFKKFYTSNGKIAKYQLTDEVKTLITEKNVRIRAKWGE